MKSVYYSRSGSYSKSFNAFIAESEKRLPLTRACKIFASHYQCSEAKAKAFLKTQHSGEWHHVGKYANCVDYFDVSNLEEYREGFQSFNYIPEKKIDKPIMFKCWNLHRDTRKLEYSFTKKSGNNLYTLSTAERILSEKLAHHFKARHNGTKATRRVSRESILKLLQVLKEVKKESGK